MQDDSVDLWATYEVHFRQHGSRRRMWIPPEIKDPVLLHAPARKSVANVVKLLTVAGSLLAAFTLLGIWFFVVNAARGRY